MSTVGLAIYKKPSVKYNVYTNHILTFFRVVSAVGLAIYQKLSVKYNVYTNHILAFLRVVSR